MRHILAVLALVAVAYPGAGLAQNRDETLADIRQEMSVLYVEIQKLNRELSTTGNTGEVILDGSLLDRVGAIEGELQRLTAKTEELEFRIDRVVRDGTNRIGDLEFRLVELEGGDISALGETTTLGGVEPVTGDSGVITTGEDDEQPQMAAAEEADYQTAQAAMDAGDYAGAAGLFAQFQINYPGGPLSDQAGLMRGRALESAGDLKEAGRAYLDLFSENDTGPLAAEALSRLGNVLGQLGKTEQACVTLAEVELRFPQSGAVPEARSAMQNLGCQ